MTSLQDFFPSKVDFQTLMSVEWFMWGFGLWPCVYRMISPASGLAITQEPTWALTCCCCSMKEQSVAPFELCSTTSIKTNPDSQGNSKHQDKLCTHSYADLFLAVLIFFLNQTTVAVIRTMPQPVSAFPLSSSSDFIYSTKYGAEKHRKWNGDSDTSRKRSLIRGDLNNGPDTTWKWANISQAPKTNQQSKRVKEMNDRAAQKDRIISWGKKIIIILWNIKVNDVTQVIVQSWFKKKSQIFLFKYTNKRINHI